MYRSCLILISTLTILMFFSGCAKKNLPVEEVPAEPIAAKEPVKIEAPVPVESPEQKDPLVDAGLFALEAKALNTVFFNYDSYQLSPESMASLKSNAEMLQADPVFKVTIEGHCDERGSDEYNMSLGELRAHAVKTYLASLGIEQERLTVISFGEEQPVVTGKDETSWEKNRRVEFN